MQKFFKIKCKTGDQQRFHQLQRAFGRRLHALHFAHKINAGKVFQALAVILRPGLSGGNISGQLCGRLPQNADDPLIGFCRNAAVLQRVFQRCQVKRKDRDGVALGFRACKLFPAGDLKIGIALFVEVPIGAARHGNGGNALQPIKDSQRVGRIASLRDHDCKGGRIAQCFYLRRGQNLHVQCQQCFHKGRGGQRGIA